MNMDVKTIKETLRRGELSWINHTIYGISKARKDTMVVNGKKNYFNYMDVIKEIKYDKNE